MDIGIGNIGSGLTESMMGNAVQSAAQSSDDAFARKLEEAARKNDDKELKKACQEFESIMLGMLYKQMKATVIKSDLIEEDPGTEIFQSMYDDELMERASKTGSLGLAESLYKQLSRQYGKASAEGAQGAGDPPKAEEPSAADAAGAQAAQVGKTVPPAGDTAPAGKGAEAARDESGGIIRESEPVREEDGI